MTKLANVADIPDNCGLRCEADGKEIALFKVNGEIHAICAVCPHAGGPLEEGICENGVVTCPWHAWDYDVRTGVSPSFGIEIEKYNIEVKDGVVYLKS